MNLQSKFGYCIITQTLDIALCKCKRDGITDGQTDRQMDDPNTWRTFQVGGIKNWSDKGGFWRKRGDANIAAPPLNPPLMSSYLAYTDFSLSVL